MSEKKSAITKASEATLALATGSPRDVSVGIRELRDHLSQYLEQVKAGAAITVTEHGHVIATIVPMTFSKHMLELAAQGKVRLPTRPPGRAADFPKIEVEGGISDLLREARL